MPNHKTASGAHRYHLENDCASCKEIFYKASKADDKIGVATVYRMINALEDIGAISRKNMYKVECSENCEAEGGCEITLDDNTICRLSPGNWNKVVREGMKRVRVSEESENCKDKS